MRKNKFNIFCLIVFNLLFFPFNAPLKGQSYYQTQFRAEDGIGTDIVKCITQDKLGFIWIGTDDGLYRYDGYSFTSYKSSTASSYIKDFLTDRSGELYAIHDLGITHLLIGNDSVSFRTLIEGTSVQTNGKVWFPKSGFADTKGNLWFGEPQSVIKWQNNLIQRYQFDDEENSTSFIRSFNFVQLNEDSLLITSLPGHFFIYRYSRDSIYQIESDLSLAGIAHMIKAGKRIFIASEQGLVECFIKEKIHLEIIQPGRVLSYLTVTQSNQLIATTYYRTFFILNLNKPSDRIIEYTGDYTTLNHIFESRDGNLWLSTEKGVICLQPKQFEIITTPLSFIFIESIIPDESQNKIYFLSKEDLLMYHQTSKAASILFHQNHGYLLSGLIDDGSLWITNESQLLQFKNEVLQKRIDFNSYGRYLFKIIADSSHHIWITQEANSGIIRYNPLTDEIKHYDLSESGLSGQPNVVKIGKDGMYIGTNDSENALLYKSNESDVFHSIVPPFKDEYQPGFRVEDLEIDGTSIWLGTTRGLFLWKNETLQKINFNAEFEDLTVRSILVQGKIIWFGNPRGLFRYNKITGDYSFYNEKVGLPANSVNEEGIVLYKDQLLIGTPNGIAKSTFESDILEITNTPRILKVLANGLDIPNFESNIKKLPSNSYLEIHYSALTYPSNSLFYSYRIPELDTTWSPLTNSSFARYSEIPGGNYTFQVRAKKTGNYVWSDYTTLKFIVAYPFTETFQFYILIIFLLIIIILITRQLTRFILIKRQEQLKQLVYKRTLELENVNESLENRNKELDQFVYSTSHDLSAPLKSLLGLINIYRKESGEEEKFTLINMMEKSIFKLELFIKEIVDYSRNTRNEITYENVDIEQLTYETLDNHNFHPNFSNIETHLNFDLKNMMVDKVRLKIILNNMISNAIKFVDPKKSKHFLTIKVFQKGNEAIFIFQDNGIGISPLYRDKIYNMFFRASDNTEGTGLGLYITKECILKLNGSIDLVSEEGTGTTFTIHIPMVTETHSG